MPAGHPLSLCLPLGAQPLSDPMKMPLMKYFWRKGYASTIGPMVRMIKAA